MDGSRARRRRPESPEIRPTQELRDTDAATRDTLPSTSSLQQQQPAWGQSRKRRRSRAAKDRSGEEKRAWIDDWVRERYEETDHAEEEKMKDDDVDDDETDNANKEEDAAGEEDGVAEEEDDEVVSSAPSSPLRVPIESDKHRFHYDPAYVKAFRLVEARYKEKRARQKKLPTLDDYKPTNRHAKVPKPLLIREPERRVVLRATKVVVGVSSSAGGKLIEPRCSGFWIDWDKEQKTGIVLTTADLVFQYHPSSILKRVYAHDAEVIVHLRDDTAVEAHLLYYQQHYNLAFFRVTMDQHVHVPSFNEEVQCGQEIFELGRDEHSYLRIGHGRVENPNPMFYHGYHYMNVLGGLEDFEYSKGGPVIDFDGNVVGIITSQGSVMLSSILLKCLRLWRKFRYIPRPHIGLRLFSIRLLDLAIAEKISVKCKVDEGLIVKEVSKGSHAEQLGIRVRDVIQCFNGERICNTLEFENMLLSTCEDHLERGNDRKSKVDILVKIFHPRKGLRNNKTLVVDLSEEKENIQRVYYPFTIGEGVCASDSLDELSSD